MTVIVMGAGGMLGRAVVKAARRRDIEVVGLTHPDCDITNMSQVQAILGYWSDSTVINCAGVTRGRAGPTGAMQNVNARGPHVLSRHAKRLVQVSTDCVFDGSVEHGYTESSPTCPEDAYGVSKLAGEVTEAPHLTVRASFIGLGPHGFLQRILRQPRDAEIPGYVTWLWNGSYVGAFAEVLLGLALNADLTGLVHVPGPTTVSKHWLVSNLAARLRPDLKVVAETPAPKVMVLASSRISLMEASWDQMMDQLAEEYERE